MIDRLDQVVAILAGGEIERDRGPRAAALLRPLTPALVGQKVLHRPQQKRAEAAALPIGDRQVILGQEADEELLRQVLGVLGRVARPANEGIEREPVALA